MEDKWVGAGEGRVRGWGLKNISNALTYALWALTLYAATRCIVIWVMVFGYRRASWNPRESCGTLLFEIKKTVPIICVWPRTDYLPWVRSLYLLTIIYRDLTHRIFNNAPESCAKPSSHGYRLAEQIYIAIDIWWFIRTVRSVICAIIIPKPRGARIINSTVCLETQNPRVLSEREVVNPITHFWSRAFLTIVHRNDKKIREKEYRHNGLFDSQISTAFWCLSDMCGFFL